MDSITLALIPTYIYFIHMKHKILLFAHVSDIREASQEPAAGSFITNSLHIQF